MFTTIVQTQTTVLKTSRTSSAAHHYRKPWPLIINGEGVSVKLSNDRVKQAIKFSR